MTSWSSFFAQQQGAVLAGQPDRTTAMLVEVADDLLVDLPDQHHLHHRHGFGIGDPHAPDEFGDDAVAFEGLVDLRTAAMDDDRIDPQ